MQCPHQGSGLSQVGGNEAQILGNHMTPTLQAIGHCPHCSKSVPKVALRSPSGYQMFLGPSWVTSTLPPTASQVRGGGFGMTPWCDDLVCSWRRLLADRHTLPFPWTLSLHRWWCPSASHHPLTFLFLLALTFPLPSPFPSLGLSLCRPPCPSASPHSFPSLSLGRLCQRSPRTCPVSLLCVESTQRKANAFAVGQVRPSGHPKPAVRYLSPTAAGGPWDGHLRGRFPDGGT